jgi:hypothetical protein
MNDLSQTRWFPIGLLTCSNGFFAVFGGASELGEAEFARYEIEHGDHVSG